jgi:hypothetical protein
MNDRQLSAVNSYQLPVHSLQTSGYRLLNERIQRCATESIICLLFSLTVDRQL